MAKKNWTALKAEISGFTKAQLLGLVQDLYRADASNKEFLHARFLPDQDGADLTPYKRTIRAAINPDRWDTPIKLREARKAISDYKKARGDTSDRLELMLYFVKCGNDVTLEFGDIDEPFYNSMGSMFGSIVKLLTDQDDPALLADWFPKLELEAQRVAEVGWGYGDELAEYIDDLRGHVTEAS